MGLVQLGNDFIRTTWASRPDASTMTGLVIFVTDIGPIGTMFISNGSRWAPVGGSCVLAINQTTSAVTGTVDETNLASVTVPAGLMSANGQLEIFTLWSHTSSATTRTVRIRLGDVLTGTAFYGPSLGTTNTLQGFTIIRNNNSLSSQYGFPITVGSGLATNPVTLVTSSVNTGLDTGIHFSAQLGSSVHFANLEGYSVTYVEG